MKTCFKCSRELPLTEFYVHRQMADGHLNKCKDCTRKDTADRVSILSKDPIWLESEMDRHREKSRRARVEGRNITQSPEEKAASTRHYNEKFPKRRAAHIALGNAVRCARITKLPCVVCGNPKSQGHHDDYDKPLEVIWLCAKHHAERHIQLRRKERMKVIH